MQTSDHLAMFSSFIQSNGNSPNVCTMYYKRVRTFLKLHPEALNATRSQLRLIVDSYIESLPVTSGIGATATAVRYYWTMRFGEAYFRRFDSKNFPINPSIERECIEFENYLISLNRLKEVTITQRVRKVRQYLYTMFGTKKFDRSMVNLASVIAYLSEEMAYTSASTKMGFRTEIRSYAAFICANGMEKTAAPIMKVSLSSPQPVNLLPRCTSDSDYASMLESIDINCPRGKRDYAMLVLMGNFGLRRSDVAWLTLDDIDWTGGILHITNSKSISDRSLPLDEMTGKALEDYVLNARPNDVNSRKLFLPCGNELGAGQLTPQQIGKAIGLLSEKAGIHNLGTHALRHAAASNMIRGGIPLKPVADILGHESLETTMGYLRVDIEMLRKAAACWPVAVML